MIFVYVALLLADPSQIISIREPRAASPMSNIFVASCPGTDLRIEGHGVFRPLERRAIVKANGRRLVGDRVSLLERDLTDGEAVYRLVALCNQEDNRLELQIYKGVSDSNDVVHYSIASGTFMRGELVAYRELSATEPDAFWFR